MINHSPPSNHKVNKKAIAWALFSQSVWLPALFSDSQYYVSTKSNDYDFSSVADLPNQQLPKSIIETIDKGGYDSKRQLIASLNNTSGVVLNSIAPSERNFQATYVEPTASKGANIAFSVAPTPPPQISLLTKSENSSQYSLKTSKPNGSSTDLLGRLYSRADLLGGNLSLSDLNEPLMPALARAERAQQLRTGDPLSPIPGSWREPMRRALQDLSVNSNSISTSTANRGVDQARIVHVPSSKLKQATEVPLALQSDGSVDILNKPDDPAVVEEIKIWSTKQQLPDKGRIVPAVVHLHPLPELESTPHQSEDKISSSSIVPPTYSSAPSASSPARASSAHVESVSAQQTYSPATSQQTQNASIDVPSPDAASPDGSNLIKAGGVQ